MIKVGAARMELGNSISCPKYEVDDDAWVNIKIEDASVDDVPGATPLL